VYARKFKEHGRFETDPPARIPRGETGTFKVNKVDLVSIYGPKGSVTYQLQLPDNLTVELVFTWDHPQGSAKSIYSVYSNPPNCVSYAQQPSQPAGHNQEIWLTPHLQNLDRVYDIRAWMGGVDPNTLVADLTLPGSHETCARYGGAAYECQALSIADQLDLGIRYLDIRLVRKGDQYHAYHGNWSQDISLDQICEQCAIFLAHHPTETVLMLVSQEGDGDPVPFARGLDPFFSRSGKLFYTDNSSPSLKDAAGKIVLLRRYSGSTQGIDCTGWPNDSEGWISQGTIYTQDFYKVSLVPGIVGLTYIGRKWGHIESTCDFARNNPGKLCINYSSGANGAAPEVIAKDLNARLYSKFSRAAKGRYGVIVMDYVNAFEGAMIPFIIATNTFKEN